MRPLLSSVIVIAGLLVISSRSYMLQEVVAQGEPNGGLMSLKSGGNWGQEISQISPVALPDGRIIITAGDTIYMIGRDSAVKWHYSPGVPLTSQPAYREDRREIAIVGMDLTYQLIDADTGKMTWAAGAIGGRSVTTDVKAYRDGYLLVKSMEEYRSGSKQYQPFDRLSYYGPKEVVWSIDFPAGASLMIVGNRVYAVLYYSQAVSLQEVKVPA